MDSTAVLNRWADYCSGLYIHELHPDTSLLQKTRPHTKGWKHSCGQGRGCRGCAWSESRNVFKSGQHSLWAAEEWKRVNNNSIDSNTPEDLGDKEMAEGVGTIARHPFAKDRQPQAMSKLPYHQPNQPPCLAKPCSELFSSDSRPSVRKWRQKNE